MRMSGTMKQMKTGSELKVAIISLLILCSFLGVAILISGWSAQTQTAETMSVDDGFTPGPPPPEVEAQLAASSGFQALVSYTDRGFEPLEVAIKKGETVRFVNNSSEDLWIASTSVNNARLYPGTSACGASVLDTCKPLKVREFWEFTFDTEGTWGYLNNLHKERSGVVIVK